MRVRRYFAFVDLCGFTRFTEVHGDEEAVAVLTGFRTLVRFIASEHGVRVAKWLGDGVAAHRRQLAARRAQQE